MGNEIWKEDWVLDVPEDAKERIRFFAKWCKINSKTNFDSIIDLGAGNGYLSSLLKSDEYDFYPRENQTYIDLSDISTYPNKIYRTGVLSHVLEHVPSPINVLRNIACQVDTELFIAVPDAGMKDNKHKPFSHSLGHISYFTLELIKAMCYNNNIWVLEGIDQLQIHQGYGEIFFKLKRR